MSNVAHTRENRGEIDPDIAVMIIGIIAMAIGMFVFINDYTKNVRMMMRGLCALKIAEPKFDDAGKFVGYNVNIAERETRP